MYNISYKYLVDSAHIVTYLDLYAVDNKRTISFGYNKQIGFLTYGFVSDVMSLDANLEKNTRII